MGFDAQINPLAIGGNQGQPQASPGARRANPANLRLQLAQIAGLARHAVQNLMADGGNSAAIHAQISK